MTKKQISSVIGFILFIALLAASAYYVYRPKSIVDQLNSQLAALRANDLDTAYSYTSDDFKRATTKENFQRFIEQYPQIQHNVKATYSDVEVDGDNASLKAIVRGADGQQLAVEYHFVKEDDDWKIIAIQVTPNSVQETAEEAVQDAKADKAAEASSNRLTKIFDNKESHYLIKYPTSWEFDSSSQGTVIFSGRQGTPAYYATINVQTVLTKKTGGQFRSVKEFISDIKKQAKKESRHVSFLANGPYSMKLENGEKLDGEYLVFAYGYRGESFKQWQIVLRRQDGQVFYAWAYTAPAEIYDRYHEVAKSMLESWQVY
jgi:hypothetical protein